MLNKIAVDGTELEYQLRGTGAGEPVVLIHWGVAATWAEPLMDQPALTSRYQLLRSCCCTGCPTPSHSTCPASRISCTPRTPPPWPTG